MTFLTPGYLAAGAALIAIPIAIHLLNRRRHQVVQWAAMRYLLEAMRQNRRRLRFESLALLLARCAAMALLALALARPVGCTGASVAAMIAGRAGLHVFVVDDSYSMAYEAGRPDARTHFEQAKRLARQAIGRLRSGDQQVAVIAASTPARIVVQPTRDLDAAADVVSRMAQSSAGTDLAGALRLSGDLADRSRDVPDRTLVLLTDATAGSVDNSPQLPSLARAAAERFRITVQDLGLATQANAAVLDVEPGESFVRAGFNTDVKASAKGFGSTFASRLEWRQDDRVLPGGESIQLDANTATVSNAQARFDRAGPSVVEVRVVDAGDRLPIDDARRTIIDAIGEVKVLIVEGRRGLGALQGSGAFLRLALAPPVESGETGTAAARYVSPVTIGELELPSASLGEYRTVMLAGVSAVTPETAEALRRYVTEGGSIVLFMGESVRPDAYNASFGAAGLLPGTIVERLDHGDASPFTFDFDPNAPDAMLGAFARVEKSGLNATQVTSYERVRIDPKRDVERVLNFKSTTPGVPGDPAITSQPVGRGQVIFVATSADAEWSTLVAKPAYVSLVHELLGGAIGNASSAWLNRDVGDALELPSSLRLTATPTLLDAKQRSIPIVQAKATDGAVVWRSSPLTSPGLYRLTAGAQAWPIAVNLPAAEADVRTLEPGALRHALGDANVEVLGDALPSDVAVAGAANDVGLPILAITIPLLAIESVMAMRFSRGRGGAEVA